MSVEKITRSQVTLRVDLPGADALTVGALQNLALAAQKAQVAADAPVSVVVLSDDTGPITRIEINTVQEATTDV